MLNLVPEIEGFSPLSVGSVLKLAAIKPKFTQKVKYLKNTKKPGSRVQITSQVS